MFQTEIEERAVGGGVWEEGRRECRSAGGEGQRGRKLCRVLVYFAKQASGAVSFMCLNCYPRTRAPRDNGLCKINSGRRACK